MTGTLPTRTLNWISAARRIPVGPRRRGSSLCSSLGYTAPEPERPFGLSYAKMGFTNSDIDEHGQIKPGAPREQLYNLATDLRQRTNLALEDPDLVRAMRARFLELAGPAAIKTPGATE